VTDIDISFSMEKSCLLILTALNITTQRQ